MMKENKTFNEAIFKRNGGIGVITGIIIALIAYNTLGDMAPDISDTGDRLGFAIKWMIFPVFSIVIGFMGVAFARLNEGYIAGTAPKEGSHTEINRRYLLNTLEQFAYFFVVQLAFSVVAPVEALVIIPVQAIMFLLARIIFWKGYCINPAYRSFGGALTHVNMFIMLYVMFQVLFG